MSYRHPVSLFFHVSASPRTRSKWTVLKRLCIPYWSNYVINGQSPGHRCNHSAVLLFHCLSSVTQQYMHTAHAFVVDMNAGCAGPWRCSKDTFIYCFPERETRLDRFRAFSRWSPNHFNKRWVSISRVVIAKLLTFISCRTETSAPCFYSPVVFFIEVFIEGFNTTSTLATDRFCVVIPFLREAKWSQYIEHSRISHEIHI